MRGTMILAVNIIAAIGYKPSEINLPIPDKIVDSSGTPNEYMIIIGK
jgi:hypothetical protein